MDVTRDLSQIAVKLSQQARVTGLSASDLQRECPWICRQIAQDAKTPSLFDFWNLSNNFDELTGVNIVEPEVLSAIGQIAGVPMNAPIVHAGLQHTYGYLLSTIVTPYGYKRDRWISPLLEQGFGLPTDVLGPNPSRGTLLANATLLAASIAFRGDATATEKLLRIAPSAAPSVRNLDAAKFKQTRIVEALTARNSAGQFRSIRIRTDLVRFPCPTEDGAENCLLVYSIQDSGKPGPRLTTLFPISSAAFDELTHPDRFGIGVEIRTRFNAVVPGISGQLLVGRRTIEQVKRSD